MSNWALTIAAMFFAVALFGVVILSGAVSAIGQVLVFIILVAVILGVMHSFRKRV